jgi:hypothetical protein
MSGTGYILILGGPGKTSAQNSQTASSSPASAVTLQTSSRRFSRVAVV